LKKSLLKPLFLASWTSLALCTLSCSDDDLRKELRQANDELRKENRELREKVGAADKQLAQLTGRFEELQRSNEARSQKTSEIPVAAPAETKQRSEVEASQRLEAEARLRTEQIKQQTVSTVSKIAAQLDRLMEEVPSVDSSLAAWDVAMPKVSSVYKNAVLQMNSLVAELQGLKFKRTEEIKAHLAAFSNGYQSLPGIGRIVVSSRERAATFSAVSDPAQSDLDTAASEEATLAAQLAVFNATTIECRRLQTEVARMAD
jgi:DNA repair exonuclease SbcCD ATPase subunit